jgi:hypothetical protein
MAHIGQQWPKKHLMYVLETRLMTEKAFRDAFVSQVTASASRVRQPIARSIPHSQMFQRKLTCWNYNQHGLFRGDIYRIPKVDHNGAEVGLSGTREWVPWLNIHQFTAVRKLRSGQIMMHRVHHRGYGLDPHLRKGKWTHRWNKCLERDTLQLTRS